MRCWIDLVEDNQSFNRKIMSAFIKELNSCFSKAIYKIRDNIGILFAQKIIESPEVLSIQAGTLRGHFGIISPGTKINQLKQALSDSVIVRFDPININRGRFTGGIVISAIKSDYSDLIDDPDFTYDSGSDDITGDSHKIEWLRWLLLEGTNIIISDHEIKFQGSIDHNLLKRSRSGMAVMVASRSGYRIPPEYAGTNTNNFITRSLDEDFYNKLSKIIESEIKKSI